MNTKSKNIVKTLAWLVASTVLLAGCSTEMDSTETSGSSGEMMNSDSSFSSMDIMFAQMMIPHHQQALDMSVIAASKSQNPEILKLASDISNEQEPEIIIMRNWIDAAGASEDMGHAGHTMDGMLTEEEMATLLSASVDAFDELFLRGMIAHHEGAIAMAQMVLDSENPEVKKLAEAVVASQQEQIDYMRTLLTK